MKMTKRKKWKGSKTVLSLLLSAMMIVEPFGTAAAVYAAEDTPATVEEDMVQQESEGVENTIADETEGAATEAADETEDETKQDSDIQEKEENSESDAEENENSDKADTGDENSDNQEDTEDQNTDAKNDEQPDEEDVTPEDDTAVSGNDLEDNSVSENDLENQDKEDETDQITDMPAKYQLTAAQLREKEILAGEVSNINESDEGVLYAKGQVMVAADSLEEAEMIAEAYNAEIAGFENGLLLLKLQEGNTVASAVKQAASARNRLPAVWPNYYRYPYVEEAASEKTDDTIEIEETEYETEDSADIEYVDEEGVPTLEAYVKAAASYNDPALIPDNLYYQWQHVAVGSPYAWAEGYTGAGVKVAVLDTGVMGTHSELTLAAEANTTGESTVTGTGTAADSGGHGTHVAGIIAAKANNGTGGAGIAPDATLYAVNVLRGGEYAGTDWAIARGIEQAINWNVDVINMSLGGPGYNQLCQDSVTAAYNKGIAIFVAAGNDGASCINYPAHYDHIICVAATDQNNSRADFSTYGSWVDLSAPGVAVWSTYNDGAYKALDGTSMACPVAAGEAAVILSGDASLKAMAKSGDKVDALEKKMKSNAVKASGSGIGAGVTSLTKVFKLTTADVKPQAPVIAVEPDNAAQAQQVMVTITAQGGMTIYYTDNGKNPVYKNGVPDANTKLYRQPFVIKKSAKGSIKAIAVNESGVASAVKSVKYTLKPYVSSITISGAQKVAAGKSIQLSAEVLPAYASNKKVEWKLLNSNNEIATAAKDYISISTSGKVTAKAKAEVGAKYMAQATAKDGSGVVGTYEITIIAGVKIKSVKFTPSKVTLSIPDDKNGYDLFAILAATTGDQSNVSATDFKWSSSNKAIATVDANGKVKPHKAGTAKITALADDSSNKKATCTVTVKQLATSISISGSSSIAAGKSATFKATVFPADTTLKKVTWSVVDSATGETPAADKGVKINAKNGKLTTTSAAKGSYIVKATATDGSTTEKSKTVVIQDGAIAKVTFADAKDKKITLFRKQVVNATKTSATVNVNIEATAGKTADLDAYEVSSSNPGIATVTSRRTNETIALTIRATGRAAGKANITLVTTDGSNKKVTCAVTVNNPVTKIHITSNTKTASANSQGINMVVLRGKSLQLKAKLESEYGAISNKKVKWSINSPTSGSGVSINKNGKVSATKSAVAVIYTVTAEALDGSGVTATYTVMPVDPATYVRAPALKHPLPNWVWSFGPLPNIQGVQQFVDPAPVIQTDVIGGYIEATSSNPKAMEVTVYYDQEDGQYVLFMTPHVVKKKTIVTITVKATDGSGVKSSYKVMVTPD